MKISSTPVFVRQENVDTDQIIPARFLKVTDNTGIGRHLFADRPDLRVEAGYPILVAAHNFGCGSSREHAVWALTDFGIRAVISTGFSAQITAVPEPMALRMSRLPPCSRVSSIASDRP